MSAANLLTESIGLWPRCVGSGWKMDCSEAVWQKFIHTLQQLISAWRYAPHFLMLRSTIPRPLIVS